MKKLPITKVYQFGFIFDRASKSGNSGIKCSICQDRTHHGLGGTKSGGPDDVCVAAFAEGWKLPATGTFCNTCAEKSTYPVYRVLGWFLNWFPPPAWFLLVVLLSWVAWFTATVVQYNSVEIKQVEVISE